MYRPILGGKFWLLNVGFTIPLHIPKSHSVRLVDTPLTSEGVNVLKAFMMKIYNHYVIEVRAKCPTLKAKPG